MRLFFSGIACLALVLVAGCGGGAGGSVSPAEVERLSIADVAELYRVYSFTKKKPPEKLADLRPFEQGSPAGYRALRSGDVVLLYGATMPDAELEGPAKSGSDEVLAYQKQVPTDGGQVVMLDRTTRKMTAEEFKSARKAGK
jgi:hypothetical protein